MAHRHSWCLCWGTTTDLTEQVQGLWTTWMSSAHLGPTVNLATPSTMWTRSPRMLVHSPCTLHCAGSARSALATAAFLGAAPTLPGQPLQLATEDGGRRRTQRSQGGAAEATLPAPRAPAPEPARYSGPCAPPPARTPKRWPPYPTSQLLAPSQVCEDPYNVVFSLLILPERACQQLPVVCTTPYVSYKYTSRKFSKLLWG